MDTKEIPEPIGKWVIENMKTDPMSTVQTQNGVMIHYSEVCRLVKLMKRECSEENKGR